MRPKKGILFFGLIETAIGTITLASLLQSAITGALAKPPNVLVFVLISSLISMSLGIGVILRWRYFRKLLMFFAGWVILSKILVFGGIIVLCCGLETSIPFPVKNIVSILYHLIVIFYFHRPAVKMEFKE